MKIINLFIFIICFIVNNTIAQSYDSSYQKFHISNGKYFALIDPQQEIKLYKDTSNRSDFKLLTTDLLYSKYDNYKYVYQFSQYSNGAIYHIDLLKIAVTLKYNETLIKTKWVEFLNGIDDYKFTDDYFTQIIDWQQILDNNLSYQQTILSPNDTCRISGYKYYATIKSQKNTHSIIREFPNDTSNIVFPNMKSYCNCETFVITEINGDWLKVINDFDYCCETIFNPVKSEYSCNEMKSLMEKTLFREGWIRWRTNSELLVDFYFDL